MKIQVMVFWVVMTYSDVEVYHPEDGGSKLLRNVVSYHFTTQRTAQKTALTLIHRDTYLPTSAKSL